MGPVAYYLVAEGTHHQTGKKLHDKFGPYASMQEAEDKKIEQQEAVGLPGYEYEYRIETVPTALLSKP